MAPAGQLGYFGVHTFFSYLMDDVVLNMDEIAIDVGVDGASYSNNSTTQIWPILGSIIGSTLEPFCIGVYCGKGKPSSPCDFIHDFCDKVDLLSINGVRVYPQEVIKRFRLNTFICDSPGRSFLTGTSYPTNSHGCSKCDIGMESQRNYHSVIGNLRRNESFRAMTDSHFHNDQYKLVESMHL